MKNANFLKKNINNTPAFIYDLNIIQKKISFLKKSKDKLKYLLLYSVKVLPLYSLLKEISPLIDGFSVSSFFESCLVKKACKNKKNIHFISPGIKESEWKIISNNIQNLTFNSLEQLDFFTNKLKKKQNYGIRVNPELSFVKNSKYDPCRKFSKLGTPINQLKKRISADTNFFKKINGIHLHTNCESNDFSQLTNTFLKLKSAIGNDLKKFTWINLGGGYLFDKSKNISLFFKLINELKTNFGFKQIIIEPGSFIVKDAGVLMSSVIDIIQRNKKNIAILDTTVNHLPEVFEYQYEPNILEHNVTYKNKYILAGCSCLAGDIFGTYHFKNKLNIGSKIFFTNIGNYSLAKAHTFNGINLPNIYFLKDNNKLKKVKDFTLKEYMNHCGA